MKFIFITILALTSLFATGNTSNSIAQKELQKQIEKEKKYAKEQKFYQKKDYDLKSMEINPDSLSSIPDTDENEDDFDMDDVY